MEILIASLFVVIHDPGKGAGTGEADKSLLVELKRSCMEK
jgi:hypothetical protein